jgi:hypothetical protein
MLVDILDHTGAIICLGLLFIVCLLWIGQSVWKCLKEWSAQSREEEKNIYSEYEDEWMRIHRD